MSESLLKIDDLSITDRRGRNSRPLVQGVSFELERGQCVGLVGESGSGKSLTLKAVMALLPDALAVSSGRVTVDGVCLPAEGVKARRSRRNRLAMVFQDPAASLNPLMRVGRQVAAVRQHVLGASHRHAHEDALELLADVAISDPESLFMRYPHQLSGGQRQRVMIALALATEPEFLLCDEPTTALDVTVQADILALLTQIRVARAVGVLLVSHDLPVVATASDHLVVMRRGTVVETGPTAEVLGSPRHAYTRTLISSAAALTRRIGR